MMYYVCIAIGMADCTPGTQDYHACSSLTELRKTVADACRTFDSEETAPYRYPFRAFHRMGDNWSQRVRIAKDTDRVVDVIGMTADDFERESE